MMEFFEGMVNSNIKVILIGIGILLLLIIAAIVGIFGYHIV